MSYLALQLLWSRDDIGLDFSQPVLDDSRLIELRYSTVVDGPMPMPDLEIKFHSCKAVLYRLFCESCQTRMAWFMIDIL